MSQKESIEKYLRVHHTITSMQAFEHLGCTKLATRIGEMIREGKHISKETVNGKNRYGKKTHYTKYRLEK